jgi:hypothetical protein
VRDVAASASLIKKTDAESSNSGVPRVAFTPADA